MFGFRQPFLLRANDGPASGGAGTDDAGNGGGSPGAGAGPTTGAEPRADQPSQAAPAGGQGQPQTDQSQAQAQPYAVFPTADALNDRLDRARQQGASQFLEDLGVEDSEALKQLVQAAKEAEEANKTELEKLEGRLTKAREKQQALEAERDKMATQLQLEREDRLVERLAGELGFADVTDAVSLVDRSQFEYSDGDDARVKAASVKAALEKLLESKPHLRGQAKPAPRIDAQAGTGKGPASPPAKKDYSAHLPARLRRARQRAAQE